MRPVSWLRSAARTGVVALLGAAALWPAAPVLAQGGAVQASTAAKLVIPAGKPWPAPYRYIHSGRPLPAAQPGERTLLTLDNGTRRWTLTLRQLQALPAMRYRVTHPHMHLSFTYEGVPLRDLAALGGFAGKDLRVYAANGYVTTIHAKDYMTAPLLLAYAEDGKAISVLHKGPLTVVLPPTPLYLRQESYGYAWVWYAIRITPAP